MKKGPGTHDWKGGDGMEKTEKTEDTKGTFRAWRQINQGAFAENIREIRGLVGEREPQGRKIRIMAVVKANAYGHGDVETARVLLREGITDLAVATLEEGIRLRDKGISGKILILGYTPPALLPKAREYGLMQTIVDENYCKQIVREAPGLSVHLKINTGMNRLGVNWNDRESICGILGEKSLDIQGIFSHLNMADGESLAERDHTGKQIRRFTGLLAFLEERGLCPRDRHLQSSYGILQGPIEGCNLVRPGIFLYGVHSSMELLRGSDGAPSQGCKAGKRRFHGTPALSVKARVAQVRRVEPGEAVSYGPEFHAKAPMRVAVLTIGYADGIPRCLKGGFVELHGKQAPVTGRICMDQMEVDVTRIPETAPGDVATVLGRAEELAEQAGTITNELLSRLGTRLPVVAED